jgi:tripartite-type tricarboxylate transporter receptor subunit TctC
MRRYRFGAMLAVGLLAFSTARAGDWPARPITLVVPYAAGGPTDAIGRLFAQQMGELLKQEMVVENVGGAGGMIGAGRVAHSPPDGYQVLFGGGGSLTYNQIIYSKPSFNSLTDFTPVALLTQQPLVLIARNNLAANNLQEFIRVIQGKKVANFGSAGVGSSTHLGCVMLNLALGVEAAHVPYRGVALAMQDLIGGRIDYICNQIQDALPQIQAGNVKAIAVLSGSRSPLLADVPTAAEQGLLDLDISGLVRALPAERHFIRDCPDAARHSGSCVGGHAIPASIGKPRR